MNKPVPERGGDVDAGNWCDVYQTTLVDLIPTGLIRCNLLALPGVSGKATNFFAANEIA